MAKAYDPYGVTAQSVGNVATSYGFTGEQTDSYIKLIYLRSRMYSPTTGRFQTKDSWQGDYNRPLSLNQWNYTDGNPINLTDPSGNDPTPPTPDPHGNRPTIEPAGIIWSPSVNVFPLVIKDKLGNVIKPGTTFSQRYIVDPNGNYVTGACGPLSVAAVAYWWDPNGLFLRSYGLEWFWQGKWPVKVTPDYTGSEELEAIIHSLPTWNAYTLNAISDDDAYNKLDFRQN